MDELENILALGPILCRAVSNRWVACSLLYLRENSWDRIAGEFRALSPQLFVAQLGNVQRQIHWRAIVWRASGHATHTANHVGRGFRLCISSSRPHTSAYGILDRDRAPAPRIYRPHSRRCFALPSPVRMGNDPRESSV